MPDMPPAVASPKPGQRMTSLRHQLPLLPPGTRVQRLAGGQLGTVQQYGMEHSSGCFPIRWDGGLWETCGADDVRVIPATGAKPRSAKGPRNHDHAA